MTLLELSPAYRDSAAALRCRIARLRALERSADAAESFALRRRIAALTPLLAQARELAALTAQYYDRGYYRDEKYTV